jgi:hypothetical protein
MANRSDNFNRADNASALGTPSDAGSDWTAIAGTWGVGSNVARKVNATDGQDIAVLDSGTANVEAQVTFSTLSADAGPGLVARLVDSSNYLLVQCRGGNSGSAYLELYKFVSGTPTSLGTYNTIVSAGDVVKLRCDGDSLTVYRNGSSVIGPVTESAHNTATKHGIQAYWAGSGASSGTYTARHDDFSITDIGGASWFTRDRKRTYLSPWLRR